MFHISFWRLRIVVPRFHSRSSFGSFACAGASNSVAFFFYFLLGGAAGGRLVFSCESLGQRGPKVGGRDKGNIIRSAHQQRFHIFQNTIQRYGQEKYFPQN